MENSRKIQNSNNIPECLKNVQLPLISKMISRARAKIDYLMDRQNCSLKFSAKKMIRKICKKRNHRTSECFHKKNRVKNRKFSFQNKAPKITEPTKTGLDSKSLPGKTSLGQEPKTVEIKSGFV